MKKHADYGPGASPQKRRREKVAHEEARAEKHRRRGIALGALPCPEVVTEIPVLQKSVMDLLDMGSVRETMAHLSRGFRNRKLSVVNVVCVMLYFVVGRLPSFLTLLDALAQGKVMGCRKISVTSASFCERLQKVPHTCMLVVLQDVCKTFFERVSRRRAWVQQLAPFAQGIYAIDDTTLDALARKVSPLKEYAKGVPEVLAGRLACALDLNTGTFAEVLYDADSKANEKAHVRTVMEKLGVGALVVLDLGYFSFELFDWITFHFQHYVTRMREKTSFRVLQILAESPLYRDRIVFLGNQKKGARAGYPVRFVELFINGAWHGYLTNVLDPIELSAPQVWALYEQRWSIEMAFQVVKRVLGLASLRCCHQNGVLMQIWATMIVYQSLQALRLQIAAAAGWEEDRISWEMLIRRIQWYVEERTSLSLLEWLCTNAHELRLVKRGTRKRRDKSLNQDLLHACQKVRSVEIELLPERRPLYKQELHRTAVSRLELAQITQICA